jgi:hypothetical protein
VFVNTKIPRFSNKTFLKANKREENELECMVDMWEGRADVGVPLRSCQVRKDAPSPLFGLQSLKKKWQKEEGEGADEVNACRG